MNFPPFEAWPKIPRHAGKIVITEKLDGTNAQVFIPESGDEIYAGSRTRWITPQQDNYHFAEWVQANRTELLKLGPGRHFGECCGSGIHGSRGHRGLLPGHSTTCKTHV